MKFLHTADWHIGKTLKGRHRLDEQKEVLEELVGLARAHAVDAVLLAGDIYESSAPSPEAQRLVVRTLLALAKEGIEVVAIAGNHDNAATFEAYRPLMGVAGIHLYGQARPRDRGGVHSFTRNGETANVAIVPFLSQRYAVHAAQLIAPGDNVPARNVGNYDQWVRNIVNSLAQGYSPEGINVMMAHLTCTGGLFGGGERMAQSIFEYHVPAAVFPLDSHYVALGHLHRRQELAAGCPVHYSGSPIQVDFGEQDNSPMAVLVEAYPGTPAKVTDIPIRSGRRLRTVEGTVEELRESVETYGEDWLRVRVKQQTYAGLRDDVLQVLPNALEIHIHPDFTTTSPGTVSAAHVAVKSPLELFADYCAHMGVADERMQRLFNELHDDLTSRR